MVEFSNSYQGELDHYAFKLESFRRSDEARDQLVTDLIQKYRNLLEEHTILKDDFHSEQTVRRAYHLEKKALELETTQLRNSLESSNFVLALIDGDGFIFQDLLLKAGADGGSEAASKLQASIQQHVESLYGGISRKWPIMVHVYVSLDKLAQKLASVLLLRHPTELRAFAQSFGVNQPLFSIIDVGQGKERADYRIKEMLRTFGDNPTCKHIIFAGSHDSGYLLNLDQYKHDLTKASRITLLESTEPARGFAELPNFHRARFDAVFRTNPLPDYVPPLKPAVPHTVLRTASNGNAQSGIASPGPEVQTPIPKRQSPVSVQPAPVQSAPVQPSPVQPASPAVSASRSGSVDSTWATVGKNGASGNTISLQTKGQKKKKYIYYNKNGQRLDEPLPPRDENGSVALTRRMNETGRNLCNNWHLNRGQCPSGTSCRFQHEPKLSTSELNALRYKTRQLLCKDRGCENFDCYLGHQCSHERDVGSCQYGNNCHFRVTHGMERAKAERWDEDSNVEFLSGSGAA
ncbi:hypothetical protein BU24DRAFT_450977 [Aaosphaeria arxii CBS 175.79]|uniref:C3H1-type domain-containing protein n=1 Tax=Aaosphaeria arxii CBS 175.79 TaxID=1450172 RepID=A0A6A5XTC9_9PLEO|nr:uncharacterized protein BU24DRAFT_450977 [Aaosphaeria arxii CBS 175.79]KAF2016462.1 hypothetical protein BU24DRAFT_450977 [Aaosphaeria arxii CBS 175.79]